MTLSTTSSGADQTGILGEPVFLVASERSGTTLMRLMLDGHPDLTWCHEFSYAVDLVSEDGSPPDLGQYYDYLDIDRVFQSTGYSVDETLGYHDLVNTFLQQRVDARGGTIVGANVHRASHRLPRLWPNARYIHLVRDPRDVAASIMEQGWFGSYWHATDHWHRAELEWDTLRGTLPPDRYIEITFEDLVADPKATLTKACDFIGVPYTNAVLDTYTASTDYGTADPSRIQSWATNMSVENVGLVEARSRDLLVARGYELSGQLIPDLSASDLRRLNLRDRVGRIRARVAIYGGGLTAAEMATRFLRLKRAWRVRRLQMNEVEVQRLKKSW